MTSRAGGVAVRGYVERQYAPVAEWRHLDVDHGREFSGLLHHQILSKENNELHQEYLNVDVYLSTWN